MLKGLQKIIKSKKFLYSIGFILLIIIISYFTLLPKEAFDTEIDQGKQQYDDALEKRIAEVKEEHPRFDAELLLDVNRPYEADKTDQKGWWADVVNCKKNGDLEIYCKPTEKWIWPY